MSQSFTRVELLRRGAAAGVVIALPTSFLAACGGDDEEAAGTTTGGKKQLAKTLRFSNWTLYIDIDEKTKTHPTLDEFQQKTGRRSSTTRTSTTTRPTSGRSRGRCHRASRSTETSSC